MFPYKSLIEIDKKRKRALYLQISDCFVGLIKKGVIPPTTALPGSREMAKILSVNRQTVVASYDELESQGWVEVIPKRGTFVKEELPIITQRKLKKIRNRDRFPHINLYQNALIIDAKSNCKLVIDRGTADDRLAPIDSISRAYRSALKSCQRSRYLSNIDIFKLDRSEEIVSNYLNRTRGLRCTRENIILTQGSQMGIYLAAKTLILKNDSVIVGETSYKGADDVFKSIGTKLIEAKVDKHGLDINQVESICKRRNIKCVYVTPHHHLPTTVTLSAGRRMKLLQLASIYDFYIIEDDYDFDYHYKSSPLLPLASSDEEGRVIYVGSMSKNLAPGIRFGYMVANPELIIELKRLRMMIDRYGDLVIERAITSMIHEGEIERHLRKCLKIYRERRDYFCGLLNEKLGDFVHFEIPQGGLAVWCEFVDDIDLRSVTKKAIEKGLFISEGSIYSPQKKNLNATRMGFASLNFGEMEEAVGILQGCI